MQMTDTKPWYREPWPWIFIALPLTAVIGSIATAWIAVKSDDGVVEDDYYKRGLAINQSLYRDEAANALHLQATLNLSADGTRLDLQLAGGILHYPAELNLRILHPTLAGKDQMIRLVETEQGHYSGSTQPLTPGKWRVNLHDQGNTWRLTGDWELKKTHTLKLGATGK